MQEVMGLTRRSSKKIGVEEVIKWAIKGFR